MTSSFVLMPEKARLIDDSGPQLARGTEVARGDGLSLCVKVEYASKRHGVT
jgi:hypothetical protein